MKIIITVFLIFNFSILKAQDSLRIPPGTIKLNDSLFIDQTPVTNFMFLEYLAGKKSLNSMGYSRFSHFAKTTNETGFPKYAMSFPSTYLIEFYSDKKYLRRKQYAEFKFKYHPVLNISKKEATDYCQWRTDMVRHLYKYHEKQELNRDLANKISYRLVTNDELINAKNFFSNSNTLTEFNENLLKMELQDELTGFVIFPINEMTQSEPLINEKLDADFIGFRCVCEIKE